jgi:uncharacterized membrane protein
MVQTRYPLVANSNLAGCSYCSLYGEVGAHPLMGKYFLIEHREVLKLSVIEQSIEVQVPVRTAYNQWTQFEDFPEFMEGVEKVIQTDDTSLHWVAEIAGVRREWDAKITEQIPDERIAWTSVDGPKVAGVVTFHRIDDNKTKIMLQMEIEPDDALAKAGDVLGIVRARVKGDLERFKKFIESRGQETGAWRGEVKQDSTR